MAVCAARGCDQPQMFNTNEATRKKGMVDNATEGTTEGTITGDARQNLKNSIWLICYIKVGSKSHSTYIKLCFLLPHDDTNVNICPSNPS